jgi:hypothetical protein
MGVAVSFRLTPAQLDTLRLIEDGKVRNVRFSHGDWRIMGASPTVVGRLVQTLGLAKWGEADGDEKFAEITITGRAALERAR